MKKNKVLEKREEKIQVEMGKDLMPTDFFKDRKGLSISYYFNNNISSKAKETKKGTKFSLNSFNLKKDSTDEEIEKDLPKKHIFSETEVCAIIAELIENKSEGKDGPLLDNGYVNLFYTPSRVVSVIWVVGVWGVFDWGRGSRWSQGRRVFSPATGTAVLDSGTSDSLDLENAIKIVKVAGYRIIKEF